MENYWLRYGFTHDGELICSRVISETMPSETFYYNEGGTHKEVMNTRIIKLTKEVLTQL